VKEDQRGDPSANADSVATAVIAVEHLSVTFGGLQALADVSTTLNRGEVVAVIGPNGAGKTTFLNAICGLVRKSAGRVRHQGNDITGTHPTNIARGGLRRSFQDPPLIASATVLENILCGAHATLGYSFGDQLFRRFKVNGRERAAKVQARELLDLVDLGAVADLEAGQLPYGPRKMIDIIRATISQPSVLLLDEPSSGLDGVERARVEAMLHVIRNEFGIPMLIVEHHMDLVRAVSDRVLGLVSGAVAMDGPTGEVLESDAFRAMMAGDVTLGAQEAVPARG
jgi:branched-chain amino acid transport system ATP-binding protein